MSGSFAIKAFVFFIIFLFQITLFQFLNVKNTKLDIVLIFIVYSGLKYGINAGVVTGFIFGLIEDVMSVTVVGINIFSKTLIGLLAGIFKIFYKDNIFSNVLIVFIFTFFDVFVFIILVFLFQKGFNTYGFINNSFPVALFLNSISSPLIFYLFDNTAKIYYSYKGINNNLL